VHYQHGLDLIISAVSGQQPILRGAPLFLSGPRHMEQEWHGCHR
jgi:hypothetical protein